MRVAVAVIYDAEGRVLLTQRPAHADHGGKWEFPGGKLETGELPADALKREIMEEVGLDVQDMRFLTDIEHVYPTRQVTLHVWQVTGFTGSPVCREAQTSLRWVTLDELERYDFPEANQKIIPLLYLS
ncbi:8-oxo-dGTP diphosphatase MutT [Legionella sp. CNM-4043-24]|uniref:8-oxo-dGTP diphosphatase MutT n=1 Tax=Legionella sp. CNM-4043-24 TaxID=3421646 RepID=UPI00403A889B